MEALWPKETFNFWRGAAWHQRQARERRRGGFGGRPKRRAAEATDGTGRPRPASASRASGGGGADVVPGELEDDAGSRRASGESDVGDASDESDWAAGDMHDDVAPDASDDELDDWVRPLEVALAAGGDADEVPRESDLEDDFDVASGDDDAQETLIVRAVMHIFHSPDLSWAFHGVSCVFFWGGHGVWRPFGHVGGMSRGRGTPSAARDVVAKTFGYLSRGLRLGRLGGHTLVRTEILPPPPHNFVGVLDHMHIRQKGARHQAGGSRRRRPRRARRSRSSSCWRQSASGATSTASRSGGKGPGPRRQRQLCCRPGEASADESGEGDKVWNIGKPRMHLVTLSNGKREEEELAAFRQDVSSCVFHDYFYVLLKGANLSKMQPLLEAVFSKLKETGMPTGVVSSVLEPIVCFFRRLGSGDGASGLVVARKSSAGPKSGEETKAGSRLAKTEDSTGLQSNGTEWSREG